MWAQILNQVPGPCLEMITITNTQELEAFCGKASSAPYLTVDTEFMRERTYYSKLCLVQLAVPGTSEDAAVLVDPLEDGLALDPLYELLGNRNVTKVFHAARQDVEIFFVEGGVIPLPLFDTQVAAMVAGFGDQVGYETLVRKIAGAELDKSSRFTDWSRRPLSNAQKRYALADVTHLRDIYEHLSAELDASGRQSWVEEELALLVDPATYEIEPEEAWRRVKTRSDSGRHLAIVRELARFREAYARDRNIPRNRVIKDDAILELASTRPRTVEQLCRSRRLPRNARKGEIANGLLAAVKAGIETPDDRLPRSGRPHGQAQVNPALASLLRVLLNAKSEELGVAQKLIATSSELDEIAAGNYDCQPLTGWRRKAFGEDALGLCSGRLALRAKGTSVEVFEA